VEWEASAAETRGSRAAAPFCASGSPPTPHAAKSATAAQVQHVAHLPVQQTRLCSKPLQGPAEQFQGRATMHLFPARTHIIRDALWGRTREKRRCLIRGLGVEVLVKMEQGRSPDSRELSYFDFNNLEMVCFR
jgi:hypothetical protein